MLRLGKLTENQVGRCGKSLWESWVVVKNNILARCGMVKSWSFVVFLWIKSGEIFTGELTNSICSWSVFPIFTQTPTTTMIDLGRGSK